MSARWNGASVPDLPAPGWGDRLRFVVRAPLALLWSMVLFGLFLFLQRLDALRSCLEGRPAAPLAPAAVRIWAAGALWLIGLRMEMRGRPMAHPGAFVANHAGWLDIVVLQRAAPLFFVAKSEVRDWPGIGLIGRAIGTMFVDRRPFEARRQREELEVRLGRGDRMGIFPEGTSTDGGRVLPFKSALFGVFFRPDLRERLWVQPVSIAYRPRAGLPAAFYGWWGEMDFAPHLAQVLAYSTGGRVEVVFHPALAAAAFPDRKALAAAAWRVVHDGIVEGAAARRAIAGAALV